jgi:hypothetical protein
MVGRAHPDDRVGRSRSPTALNHTRDRGERGADPARLPSSPATTTGTDHKDRQERGLGRTTQWAVADVPDVLVGSGGHP